MHYQVLDEGGSGIIRARVLHSLLEEERNLIARGAESRVALSTENYRLTPEGLDAEERAVIGLRPLRKDRSLIRGQMILTLDGDLIRVEGQLGKNPSFWLTQVKVVRTYRRINGVTMPVSLDSTGQLRLLGSSSFRMTYHYAQVSDLTVQNEEAEP